MTFHLDYAKVVMQERMEEARQVRLLREAAERNPKSPSRLSQFVRKIFSENHAPAVRSEPQQLANPVECQ